MAKTSKKRELSWDQIGKAIGHKIDKSKWEECGAQKKPWMYHKDHCGGFGRLLFALGLLFSLKALGLLEGIPTWSLVLMVIGFMMMKL